MALQMFYTDERMVAYTASYWAITHVTVDALNNHADFCLTGWASKSARQAKAQPVGSKAFTIANKEFKAALASEEAGDASVRTIGYEVAKKDAFFEGAESV